jgi:hypothetical protein
MEIIAENVTVTLKDAGDLVRINLRLPMASNTQLFVIKPHATAEVAMTCDTGIEYSRSVLGVEPTVVDKRTEGRKVENPPPDIPTPEPDEDALNKQAIGELLVELETRYLDYGG